MLSSLGILHRCGCEQHEPNKGAGLIAVLSFRNLRPQQGLAIETTGQCGRQRVNRQLMLSKICRMRSRHDCPAFSCRDAASPLSEVGATNGTHYPKDRELFPLLKYQRIGCLIDGVVCY